MVLRGCHVAEEDEVAVKELVAGWIGSDSVIEARQVANITLCQGRHQTTSLHLLPPKPHPHPYHYLFYFFCGSLPHMQAPPPTISF